MSTQLYNVYIVPMRVLFEGLGDFRSPFMDGWEGEEEEEGHTKDASMLASNL